LKKYINGKLSGIQQLEVQSRKSEFGHLFPFLLLGLLSFFYLALGLVRLAVFILLINLIFNLYPILLQRHHQMRILPLKQLLKERQEKGITA